jgi:mono/diheme cytochrome c family protein
MRVYSGMAPSARNLKRDYPGECVHTGRGWILDDGLVNAQTVGPCLVLIALIGLGVFWWLTIPAHVAAASLPARQPDLANGQIMFNAGGCSSCHAVPKQDDRLKLVAGLPFPHRSAPSMRRNISPDQNDGIGRWSEADFVTAVVKGTSPSGAHYYPAFPYTSYQRAKIEDVRDLFAYLKTLPRRAGPRARPRHAVSIQYPAHARNLEAAVSRRQAVRRRQRAFGHVESRRLSRERVWSLRGVP